MKLLTAKVGETNSGYRYLFESEPKGKNTPHRFPDIDGLKAFKADLHIHTSLTDGALTPEERIDEAAAEGLDIIALTDHTPFMWGENASFDDAYNRAVEYGKQKGVTVIKGVELTCSKPIGHLSMLFLDQCAKYQHPVYPISDEEATDTLRRAHDDGAFIVCNHPGWPDHDSRLSSELASLIDEGVIGGIEVLSMHEFYPSVIDVCAESRLTLLSSSDLHTRATESYDLERRQRNYTIVYTKSSEPSDIAEALRERMTIAVSGDLVCGDRRMIAKLLRSCIRVVATEGTEWSPMLKVANESDISFIVQGQHSQHFVLKPHETTLVQCSPQDQRDTFFVRNAFVSGDENHATTLAELFNKEFAPSSECQHASGTDYPRTSYFCQLFKGNFRSVDEIEFGRAAVSDSFSINEATNNGLCDDDTYGAFMERLINAEREDDYTCCFATNGLLRLYIDHRLVLCNDSMCRITNDEVKVHLCRGWHILQLFYVQDFKGERMRFEIR